MGIHKKGYSVSLGWKDSSTGKLFITPLNPLEITDAKKDIEAGLIWVERSFDLNKDPEMKGDGVGEHTVLVVENADENNQVKALSYKHDIPKMEGFGLKAFSIDADTHSDPTCTGKRILFFKVNQKMSKPTVEKEKFLTRCTLS